MCTAGDVRRSLTVLPGTLTEVYDEIYKNIVAQKGSASRLALNAFRWIQCSYEPIRTQTLLDAITVEIGHSGEFSREDSIQVDDLLRACQNLILLDEGLNVFRFAHLSVDEYLETQLPRVDSHAKIAKVCLSLLCTPGAGGITTLPVKHRNHTTVIVTFCCTPRYFGHGTLHVLKTRAPAQS